MQVPAIPAGDRAKTTFLPVASPYVNEQVCMGALKIANGKNFRNVQRIDDLTAILTGKATAAK